MERPTDPLTQKFSLDIRDPKESDLSAYTALLQHAYQTAFTEPSIGLTEDCFRIENFMTDEKQVEYRSNLTDNSENEKTWLGFDKEKLVGTVTVTNHGDREVELRRFYVAPEYQDRGVGSKLWDKAIGFIGDKDVVLSMYAHNKRLLETYQRRGFEVDTSCGDNGYYLRHWKEWPENLQIPCVYLRRRGKNTESQ